MGGEAGASNNTAWDTCIRISPASKRSLQNAPLGIKKSNLEYTAEVSEKNRPTPTALGGIVLLLHRQGREQIEFAPALSQPQSKRAVFWTRFAVQAV